MKCISYKVDPNQLKNGVPIDLLDRKNVKVIKPSESMASDPGDFKNTQHLYQYQSDSPFKTPVCKEPSLLQVDNVTYQRILKKQLVKVTGGNPGQIYKVINIHTGGFVMRQLYPIGGHKYLAKVV